METIDELVARAAYARADVARRHAAAVRDYHLACARVVKAEREQGDVFGAQARAARLLGISPQFLGRILGGLRDSPKLGG